ncbi:MAG: LamG-like jellyroll fold domain-containing protein [Salinirussus sp.]
MPGRDGIGRRGATALIGNILLVAVIIVLAVTVTMFASTFLQDRGAPTAEASFSYEETPVGLRMTANALGTDVAVKVDGTTVTHFPANASGQSRLIPTAPDSRITAVSTDGDKSVLASKEVEDRSQIGDFIAFYTFEEGSGSTVIDRSGNKNGGAINGATWGQDGSDGYLEFDGSTNTHVSMPDLSVENTQVDEITIAIKYRIDGPTDGGGIQNLIEHQETQGSDFAWFFETKGPHGGVGQSDYDMQFNIGWNSPEEASINTGEISGEQTDILIGTFDGNTMTLYRNGTKIGQKHLDRSVNLGTVILGADSNPSIQNMNGRVYEMRLYYAALDEQGAQAVTNAMS